MKREDSMNEALKFLPKSIDIHSMIITGISMHSDPVFIEVNMVNQLIKEVITTEYELTDQNGMDLTLRLTKTVHHELKD